MSKLPGYGTWLQQHPLLYTPAPESLLSKGSISLPQLENTFFSGWGMALPLLCACTLHNTAPAPEGSLQGVLQWK